MNNQTQNRFMKLLESTDIPLLSDGAMGTILASRGIGFKHCFDALNLSNPTLVEDVHRAYISAGSQIIQTNTFGANRYKLAGYGLADKVIEINRAGVELAKHVSLASNNEVLIAGDIGPLGVRLAPFGRVQSDEARQAFFEQISAVAKAGIDLLIIETFSDLYEICEAIAAARQVEAQLGIQLPVVASMTYTRDDRTLLGDSPTTIATALVEAGADLIGVNCSSGPAQLWRILCHMRAEVPEAKLSAMPNAGWPEQVGGRIMYPANPDYFGEYALAFCDIGASLIGGCCGTTPQHIAAMRSALDRQPVGCGPSILEFPSPGEVEDSLEASERHSRLAQRLDEGKFTVAVEMDPPRGLSTHKLLAGASLLAEAGADVINVADSPMARMRMSPWAVCELVQRIVEIETTLHFPTRGRNLLRVQGDLLAAHALGIRNVFVVMGDPTAIGDYPDAMDNYDLVPSGLIKLIKQNFNTGLDHSGTNIGQPTSFFVGCALNLTPQNMDTEIKNLRRKVKAGADFILSQPIYQPAKAELFLQRYAEIHGPLDIPVLVGVLPLYNSRHATFLHNEVPGVDIPFEIRQRIQAAGEQSPKEGMRISLELITRMKSWASGIYLMPQFNQFDVAAEIIEGCKT